MELYEIVAPHAGAWIEISDAERKEFEAYMSHPMRVRGLKYLRSTPVGALEASHPMRVRGLK